MYIVSSLPFILCCKVAVIRGVFHQKAGSVIIPIGVLKNHPVALYNTVGKGQRVRESLIWMKSSYHVVSASQKPSLYPQGQQLNKCLYGICVPVLCRNLLQYCTSNTLANVFLIDFRCFRAFFILKTFFFFFLNTKNTVLAVSTLEVLQY